MAYTAMGRKDHHVKWQCMTFPCPQKSSRRETTSLGVIQLLESPIPATPASTPATLSQKASSGNILGTKRGSIDPLVSKRPEKILNKKIQNSKEKMPKMVKNGQKWSKMVKMVKMV